ncbi:energy-converting hydrogenase subunit EhaL family protein [Methanobrevibacter curvatus]|uniref:NiFe hydrogenase n=1 Tax=Methanobrevibacter curvatus TaxID=49547 RepID=A0A166AXF1_9EURY|nr:energy-converting hydrogenase subunit EhaL family protein [Methanobrevibacter curvatus]KZX12594.1 hypothetical protein MBCUR_10050 [Methanobrevibacter curvatus]
MIELNYLIYIVVFIVGAIAGLLFSYKKHGEPIIFKEINYLVLIMSIIGFFLLFNYGLISFILIPLISISISLFLISFVLGMRPGYGRYEIAIGLMISIIIWIINNLIHL